MLFSGGNPLVRSFRFTRPGAGDPLMTVTAATLLKTAKVHPAAAVAVVVYSSIDFYQGSKRFMSAALKCGSPPCKHRERRTWIASPK